MDEAVAWVKRCPNPMPGPSEIEIRQIDEGDGRNCIVAIVFPQGTVHEAPEEFQAAVRSDLKVAHPNRRWKTMVLPTATGRLSPTL